MSEKSRITNQLDKNRIFIGRQASIALEGFLNIFGKNATALMRKKLLPHNATDRLSKSITYRVERRKHVWVDIYFDAKKSDSNYDTGKIKKYQYGRLVDGKDKDGNPLSMTISERLPFTPIKRWVTNKKAKGAFKDWDRKKKDRRKQHPEKVSRMRDKNGNLVKRKYKPASINDIAFAIWYSMKKKGTYENLPVDFIDPAIQHELGKLRRKIAKRWGNASGNI